MGLRDYIPELRLYAAELPELVALSLLAHAAAQFCRQSLCWRRETYETESRDRRLILEPPHGAVIALIMRVTNGGQDVQPTTLDAELARTPQHGPLRWFCAEPPKIRLFGERPRTPEFCVEAALVPRTEQVYCERSVPDWLMEQYSEAIVAGALVRAVTQPGQSYSSEAAAGFYQSVFDSGVAQAKARLRTGYRINDNLRVQPEPFV